jgi:hypothetical protein
MTRFTPGVLPTALLLAASLALATCDAAEPLDGPCLAADAATTVEVPFGRVEGVGHEIEGDVEVAMFRFDRSVAGPTTIEVAPASGPYREFRFDEPVAIAGGRQLEVAMTGLIGGADTDRLRADPTDGRAIREIVQVAAEDGAAWVLGVDGQTCIRVRTSAEAATMTILVTAAE